ncbi:MAG TPA: hypothetical protein VLE91_00515 [Candidatus Saccharimonadales bacterium]|nr:hypothetical protein [Candidatus Saccharimonadales bacterium]
MAVVREVIHEHDNADPALYSNNSNALGLVVGLIVLLAFLFLLFAYGLPRLGSLRSGPSVSVPDKIDVNLNQK